MRTRSERLYARLLLAYPAPFRAEYGEEMEQLFRDCRRAAGDGRAAFIRHWLRMLGDLARGATRERLASLDSTAAFPRGHTTPSTQEEPMAVAVLAVVAGIVLGIAGLQELYFRGIVNNEPYPFLMGALGMATSLLFIAAGVGLMRGWPQRRNLMLVAAWLNVLFLGYGALPPTRTVGWNALILGLLVSAFLTAKAYRLGAPVEARQA